MAKFYYDCSKCKNQYTREDGHKGCQIIDSGKIYPIISVGDRRSQHLHSSVCATYDPKELPVAPTRRAKRWTVWANQVFQCGNCLNLVHVASKTCPHCGAGFEV